MGRDKWSMLSRLRRAIRKVKIILNLDMSRWRVASLIGAASSSRHQLSFNDRPGLRGYADFDEIESEDSGGSMGLQRTISYQSEDDIDKRAEMFIDNFRRQLQIERQISLELRPGLGCYGMTRRIFCNLLRFISDMVFL
ncbi:hypothetical protein SADUNF_Sadunf18G0075700 [Salix dunnii]|uniref:Uncharacterized protein n=1 Tax=Salix dunnii TaxID=1413687 RepID=A0A835MGE9_9ROSI|nr:hypothetical protein SADUNF_Sadunf18G0075700 [Salix dunnii]